MWMPPPARRRYWSARRNWPSLDPDVNKVKNEREKERLTRYHVAAYLWAPDSKHLMFDSQGQLWLYDLGNDNGSAVHVGAGSKRRSEVFAGRKSRGLCPQAQSVCASGERQEMKSSSPRTQAKISERRHRLGLRGRIGGAQQLFLVA